MHASRPPVHADNRQIPAPIAALEGGTGTVPACPSTWLSRSWKALALVALPVGLMVGGSAEASGQATPPQATTAPTRERLRSAGSTPCAYAGARSSVPRPVSGSSSGTC